MTIQEAIRVATDNQTTSGQHFIRQPSWGPETKLLVDVVWLFEVESGVVNQERAYINLGELLTYDWEVAA